MQRVCIEIKTVLSAMSIQSNNCVISAVMYRDTSSHDKTGFYLKRGSDILTSVNPARVRIWVISTVTAPNKHISCKSCSSRTGPSVTAKTIAYRLLIV